MRRRFAMHIHISTLFVVIFIVAALASGITRHRANQQMLDSTTTDLMRQANREATDQLDHTLESATLVSAMLSRTNLPEANTYAQRSERLDLMREALKGSNSIVSVFAGYGSGDMFLLRRLRNDAEVQAFKAPEGTRYMLQSTERGLSPPRGRFVYLDEDLQILREDDRPDYAASYDPRSRGWYKQARESGEAASTDPYVFFTTRKVGMTVSTPVENSATVVAADLDLETLGVVLKRQKVTPGAQLALVSPDGQMYAHEQIERVVDMPRDASGSPTLKTLAQTGIPVLEAAAQPLKALKAQAKGQSLAEVLSVDGERWRVSISPIDAKGMPPLALIVAVPESELLVTARQQFQLSFIVSVLIVALAIPVTIWAARRVSTPIRRLAGEAEAIRRFDFGQPVQVQSSILEVDELAQTMDGMKQTIRRFLTISEAVSSEEDFERLLPLLLSETMAAAQARAGVLYLADGEDLRPAAALDHAGQSCLSRVQLVQQVQQLRGTTSDPQETIVAAAVAESAPRIGPWSAEAAQTLGMGAWQDALELPHAVAVPLLNRSRTLVGCLLMLRDAPFEAAQLSFIKALSGSAASSLETRELIKAQKELFEAFIRLIAGAIDAKSAYTGGHCARVPELTKMLARAASAQTEGPFADFRLDAQDWEAVHVAAWLHDCGKITTPEYVVDKATKLETLHDRIHEVRMRFEVLKRDAQLACLHAQLAGEDAAAAQSRLTQQLAELDAEFEFVARCNVGGEHMSDEDLRRLDRIAERTWQRTLDDRIGIAGDELRRKQRLPVQTLPVVERLLDDKAEHCIERAPSERIAQDDPLGFRLDVPQLLYNRGELHNLRVRRGTLTEEDRYKINEHIVQTIRMLSTLPFPKHLRQVPEIAGGHHEKMDGTGYPRRLRREQMSPVARMMAIADVFEALTAIDRPYKKGKTLSEALQLMVRMCEERHIDPDLFELFLREGVHTQYAQRFMQPSQIDAVDLSSLLRRLSEGQACAVVSA